MFTKFDVLCGFAQIDSQLKFNLCISRAKSGSAKEGWLHCDFSPTKGELVDQAIDETSLTGFVSISKNPYDQADRCSHNFDRDPVHREKNMTTRLPFIARIKVLSRELITGRALTLNRPQDYDVVILPSSTRRGSQQSPLSSVPAVSPQVAVSALLASGRADQRWSASRQSGQDIEHTQSNMG